MATKLKKKIPLNTMPAFGIKLQKVFEQCQTQNLLLDPMFSEIELEGDKPENPSVSFNTSSFEDVFKIDTLFRDLGFKFKISKITLSFKEEYPETNYYSTYIGVSGPNPTKTIKSYLRIKAIIQTSK